MKDKKATRGNLAKPQINRRGLVIADRPRKVVVQGQQHAEHHRVAYKTAVSPRRLFEVKVLRSTSKQNQFWWLVRERDKLVKSSLVTYKTEAEAFRAGNVAARAIRKR